MNKPLIKNYAIRRMVAIIGAIGGFIAIEHGFFEMLQGSIPTDGIQIEAIAESMRFPGGVGEMALTLIPNFLATGIAACLIGITTIVWSVLYIDKKYGALGLLCLSILSLFFGGGVAFFLIAIINCLVAARINKPLQWWRKRVPSGLKKVLARSSSYILASFIIIFIFTLAIGIFGLSVIGVSDVNEIATISGVISIGLYLISIVACFCSDTLD